MQCCASSRSASVRRHVALAPVRSSQISSEEPPPMSNTMAKSRARVDQRRTARDGQPRLRSRGSGFRSSRPSSRARARGIPRRCRRRGRPRSRPDASGATRLRRSLSAQTRSASKVRCHGRVRQAPCRGHAFAEPDDAREGVDDAKAAARGPGDQQAAIVGAEVERRVGLVLTVLEPRAMVVIAVRRIASGLRVRTRFVARPLQGRRPSPAPGIWIFAAQQSCIARTRSTGICSGSRVVGSVAAYRAG